MRWSPARIAAVFYLLWGILHVVGGGVLLAAALNGADAFLQAQTENDALAVTTSSTLGGTALTAAGGVFAFHAFNLTWLGLVVAVVAVRLNWRNSPEGCWVNLALVGLTDLGLLLFIVHPGILPWSSAWIGPVLLLPAAAFSVAARRGVSGATDACVRRQPA